MQTLNVTETKLRYIKLMLTIILWIGIIIFMNVKFWISED